MTNPEPHLLIFETSGRTGLVAIAQGSRILGARRLEEARRHARDLAPAVAALLAEVGWGARDLAGVIVSRGPGSYTGLRVGIMSAKTFAYATGCALIAVDTFAAIARQVPAEALSVDVLADAQQDKIYVQRYSRPDSAAPLIATAPLNIQRIADWLVDPQPAAWITGPGLRVLGERRPAGCQVVAAELWDPQPESLVEIGLARYQTGERDDFWSVEPLYLRPSAAEEKWQERGAPRRPEAGGVSSFYTLVDLYSAQARCYASSYRGTGTENRGLTPENSQMSVEQIIIPGIVKNGLVVPQGGSPLPEGVHVNIVIAPSLLSPAERAEFAGWERASDEAWAHIDQWEREEQL